MFDDNAGEGQNGLSEVVFIRDVQVECSYGVVWQFPCRGPHLFVVNPNVFILLFAAEERVVQVAFQEHVLGQIDTFEVSHVLEFVVSGSTEVVP